MKAIVYERNGDPSVLGLVDRPVPEPGARARSACAIHRSGVNPTDWKSRRGSEPGGRSTRPRCPNQDGVRRRRRGRRGASTVAGRQRVWIWEAAYQRPRGHGAGVRARAGRARVVHAARRRRVRPRRLLGVPFLTAHRCLTVTEDGPTGWARARWQGRTVLVAGGAGAVGNAAIQLARWSDATVITTVSSPEKANLAAAAGADHVDRLPASRTSWRRSASIAPRRRRHDRGGGRRRRTRRSTREVLARTARSRSTPTTAVTTALPVRPLMVPNARWQFVLVYTAPTTGSARRSTTSRRRSGRRVRVGEEAGLPLHHYPLERTAEAHAAVESGAVGKVLITTSEA